MLKSSKLVLLLSAFLIITACNSSGSSSNNSSGAETVTPQASTARLVEKDDSENTLTVVNFDIDAKGNITKRNTLVEDGNTKDYSATFTFDDNSNLVRRVDNEFREENGEDTIETCTYESNASNQITKQTCTRESGFSAGTAEGVEYFYNDAGNIAYTRLFDIDTTDNTLFSDYELGYNSSSQLVKAESGDYDVDNNTFTSRSFTFDLTSTPEGYLSSISEPSSTAVITRDSQNRIITIDSRENFSSGFIMEDMVHTDSSLSYKITEDFDTSTKVTIGTIEFSDPSTNLDNLFITLFDIYHSSITGSAGLFLPRTDSNYPELHVR